MECPQCWRGVKPTKEKTCPECGAQVDITEDDDGRKVATLVTDQAPKAAKRASAPRKVAKAPKAAKRASAPRKVAKAPKAAKAPAPETK